MNNTLVIAALALIFLLMVFQFLLSTGLPLGKAAWGGKYKILPVKLRAASFAAIFILAFAGSVLAEKAGLMLLYGSPLFVAIVTWIFTAFFSLNILGNIVSKSMIERIVMTPVAIILFLAFLLTSLGYAS